MPSKKKDTADQLTLRTMRAAAIDRFGGPEVLSIHNLPVPVPEAGEVGAPSGRRCRRRRTTRRH